MQAGFNQKPKVQSGCQWSTVRKLKLVQHMIDVQSENWSSCRMLKKYSQKTEVHGTCDWWTIRTHFCKMQLEYSHITGTTCDWCTIMKSKFMQEVTVKYQGIFSGPFLLNNDFFSIIRGIYGIYIWNIWFSPSTFIFTLPGLILTRFCLRLSTGNVLF